MEGIHEIDLVPVPPIYLLLAVPRPQQVPALMVFHASAVIQMSQIFLIRQTHQIGGTHRVDLENSLLFKNLNSHPDSS